VVAEATVDVRDGRATIEFGGKSAKSGDFAYTFVQYCTIEEA
jgi:hypothetical protein